jgi:hypothetical protein
MFMALVLGVVAAAVVLLLPPVVLAIGVRRFFAETPRAVTPIGLARRAEPGRGLQARLTAVPDSSSGGRKAS